MENKTKIKTLLVENDDINIEVIRTFLINDFDLDIALNFNQAIEFLKRVDYKLILVDINLGLGLNGIDVLKEIKKMPKFSNLPVLAVTAYAMQGDREKLLDAGFDDYLAKPFLQSELLKIIQKHIKF